MKLPGFYFNSSTNEFFLVYENGVVEYFTMFLTEEGWVSRWTTATFPAMWHRHLKSDEEIEIYE